MCMCVAKAPQSVCSSTEPGIADFVLSQAPESSVLLLHFQPFVETGTCFHNPTTSPLFESLAKKQGQPRLFPGAVTDAFSTADLVLGRMGLSVGCSLWFWPAKATGTAWSGCHCQVPCAPAVNSALCRAFHHSWLRIPYKKEAEEHFLVSWSRATAPSVSTLNLGALVLSLISVLAKLSQDFRTGLRRSNYCPNGS